MTGFFILLLSARAFKYQISSYIHVLFSTAFFSSIKVHDIHFLNLVFFALGVCAQSRNDKLPLTIRLQAFFCSSQPSSILWLSSSIFPCWLFVPPWWHLLLLLLLLRLLPLLLLWKPLPPSSPSSPPKKILPKMGWNGEKIGFLTPWLTPPDGGKSQYFLTKTKNFL